MKCLNCQKVPCKEAAQLLGMSVSRMQALMDRKVLDIGIVIPPAPDKKYRRYEIYRSKLNKLIGGVSHE